MGSTAAATSSEKTVELPRSLPHHHNYHGDRSLVGDEERIFGTANGSEVDSRRRFTIVDYNPEWPNQFQAIKADLEADLAEEGVTYSKIEHIGSTSVPGLGSKAAVDPWSDCWFEAVLDICIVVKEHDFTSEKLVSNIPIKAPRWSVVS